MLGGETELANLALACGGCNSYKSSKVNGIDSVTEKVVPLYHPRQQQWETHFAWSADYLQIIGMTATGRATVSALKLNRPGAVNLRRLMRLAGLHP